MAAGSVMVAMTSLMRSMGMSPTTRGLLFSSWGRGSEGLRFSPTMTHGHRGRHSSSLHVSFTPSHQLSSVSKPKQEVTQHLRSAYDGSHQSLLMHDGRTDLLSVC